jgi:hypothetical protein
VNFGNIDQEVRATAAPPITWGTSNVCFRA